MGKKKIATQSSDEPLKERTREAPPKAIPVAKKSRKLESGRVYISASYNNTVVTVTDEAGNVVAWASAGSVGFSGPKKSTPFAAQKITSVISEKLKGLGVQRLEVLVRGVGGGRDSALRSLVGQGFDITSIKDVTPIPHNGPRPPKVRRV